MRVSPGTAEEFLSDHLHGRITAFERLTGGEWSEAFGFKVDGRHLVARFGDHLDDFQKDKAAAGLSSPEMPVPEVLELGQALGGHFCISQRVFGHVLEELDAAAMCRAVPAVLRLLDGLRQAHIHLWIAEVGAPADGWRERLLQVDEENDRVFGWHDNMAASPVGDEPYKKGLAFLRANVADCPEELYLSHNDLLHCNVLVDNDKITGVFDWGCGGLSDFVYELATFTFYAPWYRAMDGIDWLAEAERHWDEIGLQLPDLRRRLLCYEVHLGLSGMAYSSFKRNWKDVEDNGKRTMQVLSVER